MRFFVFLFLIFEISRILVGWMAILSRSLIHSDWLRHPRRCVALGKAALPTTHLRQFAHAGAEGPSGSGSSHIPEEASTKKKKKRRLDDVVQELFPQYSRNVIQSFIAQGKVLLDDRPIRKCGTGVDPSKKGSIRLTAEVPKYVCRAGLKMEAAVGAFFGEGELEGRVALDAGLSTGGFTDCLLQHGVSHVFGVDVGYGQVHEKIRTDPRVTVMERTNLRHVRLQDLLDKAPNVLENMSISLVSLDVSFISTLKMVDAVESVLEAGGDLVLLVKPQFEAGKKHIGAGGVCDASVREDVVSNVVKEWEQRGFRWVKLIESPVKGATSGNIEYLAHLKRE
jgi:23S rRNA (cytidine1920-2'-O)/16S rRNA (cytidine1409-2'-O)-methyltransferase